MSSRVAKNPIIIPAGVDLKIAGQEVIVKGKLGELKKLFPLVVKLAHTDGHLQVSAVNDTQNADAQSGTTRAIIQNMVTGVSTGFTKKLLLVGVGYRAKVQGNALDISVGYSHPVVMALPKGITAECPSNTEILLKGADKHLLAQMAANIRAVRPPECYKGKGIRYHNEKIILKEGKKK
ncbi:MAG: 50S ribosomal protein L6 [Gammaproteobacteria bacterium CG_4_10_14_0_8_um_filter_38_16]|nr:MAG: 50S ribosomal protein L6 [Gammaproteobacteria bacterium CG_4_10_14_0_8_um_filter_38_16]PJA02908.1 MAG: 50S ribosomal protein L6 [Gammaproteobacteria bacterium CG_4_10_14_0_2_um_filter_38_22]PJB11425.1 MAG: 50S ribosomal protein L6 [Gammaproteobacteria bacterium CG_4_9_14_3_um_filter_38_9]